MSSARVSLHTESPRWLPALAAGLVALGSRPAYADAPPAGDTVRVEYEGLAECPGASAFTERLAARSPGVRVTRDETSARRLVVRLMRRTGARASGGSVHGELHVVYADGSEARRAVDGETCESVVDALALMSAMALNPTTARAAAEPAVEPPPAPSPPDAPPADLRPPLDAEAGTHVAVGAGGGVALGMAPVAAPDAAVYVELARTTGALWSPSLRLGVDYATSGDAAVTGGSVQLGRTDATLDGCPFRWSPGPLRLTPCLHVEAGAVNASGLGVTPDRSALRPWVGAGLLGSVRYVATRRFFVEVSGGVRAALVRDRFFFEPDSAVTVFQAPVVSGFAGAAVGFTIL